MMEEDLDPFLEDEDMNGAGTDAVNCEPLDDQNELRQNTLRSSPILNASGFGQKFSSTISRKSRLRRSRSGVFPGPYIPLSATHTLTNLNILPSSPSEDLFLPEEPQSDFIAPKTPAPKVPIRNVLQQCDSDSDEDIFASSICNEQVCEEEPIIPSALNALLDGPEPTDLSWTSSMATPLASNATWSNLNTEERKVLLPSDNSNLAVKPRALFSPDLNNTADCDLWNTSSDAEYIQALRGENSEKTPKFRGRKNSLMSKAPVDSPLATVLFADNNPFDTHEFAQGSPILSGSNEFNKTLKVEEEDLFDNDEEYLNNILPCLQTGGVQHSKVAESTPNIGRKKSPAKSKMQCLTPFEEKPSNAESFLEDISVAALEEACQAQELKEASLPPLATPEKQPDTKRKRLLFATNSGVSNPMKIEFKIPETKPIEKEVDFLQENFTDHCIPDDSFMEHLAAMNTSIFSDAPQPATKVQSIKSSLSTMKHFSYSCDQKSDREQDGNSIKSSSSSEPQALMKEILSSVIALDSSANTSIKSKLMKSSGDLVVFSQLEAEMSKELDHKEGKVNVVTTVESGDIHCQPKPVTKVDKFSSNCVGLPKDLVLAPCEGFKTSNGSHIKLSEKSLCKGFNLLKNTFEIVELKELNTSSAPVIAQPKQSLNESTNFNDDLAAEEVKQLLQLVNDGEDFHPWHEMEQPLSTKSEKTLASQGQMLETTVSAENNISITNGTDELNVGSLQCGFSTASGKTISVSDEKLAQAQQFLLEVADDSTNFSGKEPRLEKNGEYEKPQALQCLNLGPNINIKNIDNIKGISCHIDRKRSFKQAANGSAFSIPEKRACLRNSASTSTPNYFNHGQNHRSTLPQQKAQSPDDVQEEAVYQNTASDDLGMNISEETINFMNNVLDHLTSKKKRDDALMPSKSKTPMSFSTAAGKTVNVSKHSLNKVKNLFDDLTAECDEEKSLQESLENMPAATSVQNEVTRSKANSVSLPHEHLEMDPSLFSTASGKKVTVSKQALNRVKNLFDDPPEDSFSHLKEKSFGENPNVAINDHVPNCAGFLTASGRTVNVSEKAIIQAQALFKEIPDPDPELVESKDLLKTTSDSTVLNQETHSNMGGFSTAAGKTVNVSKQALEKAKNLFDKLQESDPPQQHTLSHSGNSILSRKQSASNEEKQLMCHTDLMQGFSTAGGRTVNISKEALNKVKRLFDAEDLAIGSPHESISASSKARNENVLSGCLSKSAGISCQSVEMAGFSTASGKTVHISEVALGKARNLFDNLPFDSSNSLKESVSINSSNRGKEGSIVADDSGVFMSYEPDLKSKENSLNSFLKFPNKQEGQIFSHMTKSSLTQEITESTAAILADDEPFGTAESLFDGTNNSTQTISTSPSMVSDRFSNLKPILSSKSKNIPEVSEPTSPILMKTDSAGPRKRSRRGRLSLSTNVGSRPTSPLGSQSGMLYQSCYQRTRLSLPSEVSSGNVPSLPPNAAMSNRGPEGNKSTHLEDFSCKNNDSKLVSQCPPSRKLFVHEIELSPTKLHSPNAERFFKQPQKIESDANGGRMSDRKDLLSSRPSVQAPLMRKTLTRNHGAQSSGFKTPYKNGPRGQQKRSPSSPAQNPPDTKRMKTSSNLYVSHISMPTEESKKLGPRTLRPEVAEMRRRAMKEQRQLVENYTEHKGELLRPCTGSWLSRKIQNGKSRAKLIKMFELGTPATYSYSDLASIGLKSSTISITADDSAEFRFSAWDYFSEDVCRENVAGIRVGDGALLVLDSQGSAGVEEFERSFLASPGVDPSLVPCGWIKNHYRWLVWKLAALERRFPHQLGGRCLCPHILMQQLKYRFDREIDRSERPALRRILEHDDPAAKRMVLCVASILNKEQEGKELELELTDGWYSLTASIDQDMQNRVKKGVIEVGMKLLMHGAELMNCSEGCYPLQVLPDVRLKLFSNSTRRARWHAKLGFQGNPGPINVSLSSILGAGGLVSCVSAYVARVYPIAFMEKTVERTVVRSQRAESKEKAKCEKKKEELAEGVYCQVQAELQQEQNKQRLSTVKFSLNNLSNITSGEELSKILENTSDPHSVQNMLSEEQKNIFSEYQRMKQDELRSEMEARVRLKLSENLNHHERQVTPVLKVRLYECLNGKQSSAILSIWRPSEDMSSAFKEGHKLTIYGAVANGFRFGELQLSANRSTRYDPNSASEINSDLMRTVSPLSSVALHGSLPRFGELDVVGVVIRIGPTPQTPENTSYFQTVYLSDWLQNIVGISFREGMKAFGVEDLITLHSYIAASNLQWRGSPVVRAVPCIYASELSFFTTNPRQTYLQTALQELRHSVTTDLKTFGRVCEEKLDNMLLKKVSSPAFSPRTPDSILDSSKLSEEKLSERDETPPNLSSVPAVKVQRKLLMDQQLKTPTSVSGHSPAVKKRLSKLELYGEPPPLSPILISQSRRSLHRDFKAPRRMDSPSIDCKKLD